MTTDDRKGGKSLDSADTEAAIEYADAEGSVETSDTEAAVAPAPIESADTLAESDVQAASAEPMHFEEGAKIGRFIVIKKLGEGGMGVVLAAYDPLLDRKVAVKLLRPQSFGKHVAEQARKRLLREAQAMAKITHANVLPVFDAGEIGDSVFIAMEFNDGETLGHWANREKRSWREVLDVYIRAGRGLAAAHEAGLVHRDFKPENVLIDKKGRVRVTDFGLVSAGAPSAEDLETGLSAERDSDMRMNPEHVALALSLTRTGEVMGTPFYMAPEQHLGEETDARTDQFGFCVALYEALYGERPFEGETYKELAENVLDGKAAEPPRDADVPGWVRDIVLRGLSLVKNDRHLSMDALMADLESDPAVVRRRRLGIAAVATLIVLLAGGLLFSFMRSEEVGSQLCRGTRKELVDVWDDEVKKAVKEAFLATGRPYAAGTFRRVERILDTYTDNWIAMHEAACEATHVRGTQSDTMLDLRMRCLDRRRAKMSALVALFSEKPDTEVLDRAVQAAMGLASLDGCADADALIAEIPPPEHPATRDKVEALRERLDRAAARKDAGKYEEGLVIAKTVADEARTIEYRPLWAEALYRLGTLQGHVGDVSMAEATLRDAVHIAAEVKNDVLFAKIWTRLVWVVGEKQARYDDAFAMQLIAEAAIARAGGDESLQASLLSGLGVVRHHQGRHDEARDFYERALGLQVRAHGWKHPEVAILLNNLGYIYTDLSKYDEALRYFERALAIRVETLGPEHPHVADSRNGLGVLLLKQGEHDAAMAYFEDALDIFQKALGTEHPYVAYPLTGLGQCRIALGRPTEAIALLEHAVRVREAKRGDPADLARSRFALARALWEAKRDRKRALQLAEQARDAYAEAGETQKKELADVRAWVKKRSVK